jgi:hypothetical protein
MHRQMIEAEEEAYSVPVVPQLRKRGTMTSSRHFGFRFTEMVVCVNSQVDNST